MATTLKTAVAKYLRAGNPWSGRSSSSAVGTVDGVPLRFCGIVEFTPARRSIAPPRFQGMGQVPRRKELMASFSHAR
jgi:hypothetical protein